MNNSFTLVLVLCVSVVLLSQRTMAQTMIDRSKPPVIPIPREFLFPEYSQTMLSNGIRLILVEDHAQPLLSIHLVFRKGAAAESIPGLANFTAQMITRGTTSRSAQQIADEMDFLGGSLYASSAWDTTSVSLTVLTKFAIAGLNVFADVVCNASFPEDEIERYRLQALSYLQQNYSDPNYLASVALRYGLYKGHTYGHALTGTLESIGGLKRQDCLAYYNDVFTPGNAFIVATGNITIDQLKQMLETALEGWEAKRSEPEQAEASTPVKERKVVVCEKPEAAQTVLLVGFASPSLSDPDYPAMQFLNTLLGSVFISRLNANLREEKGYTYGVNSYIDVRRSSSSLVIGTSVGKDVTLPAVEEILGELQRMASEPITDEELDLTRKYMLGSFALRTATPNQVISLLSSLELFGLPPEYYEQYYKALAAITKEQLFDVQKRRFSVERLVIAASGDTEYLRSILAPIGRVEVVSAEGVPAGK